MPGMPAQQIAGRCISLSNSKGMVMKMKLAALITISLTMFAMHVVADDVDKWMQDLKDPIPAVRDAALKALIELNDTRAELKDDRAVEPLIQAL